MSNCVGSSRRGLPAATGGGVVNRPPSPLTMLLSRRVRRREVIALLGALGSPWSRAAAQTTRPLLLLVSHLPGPSVTFALLRAGLADFGYVDGRNIAIDEHLA